MCFVLLLCAHRSRKGTRTPSTPSSYFGAASHTASLHLSQPLRSGLTISASRIQSPLPKGGLEQKAAMVETLAGGGGRQREGGWAERGRGQVSLGEETSDKGLSGSLAGFGGATPGRKGAISSLSGLTHQLCSRGDTCWGGWEALTACGPMRHEWRPHRKGYLSLCLELSPPTLNMGTSSPSSHLFPKTSCKFLRQGRARTGNPFRSWCRVCPRRINSSWWQQKPAQARPMANQR